MQFTLCLPKVASIKTTLLVTAMCLTELVCSCVSITSQLKFILGSCF